MGWSAVRPLPRYRTCFGVRYARLTPGGIMTGREVLHYRIEASLGKGGMGEVFRATDVRLGRTVALKFLSDTVARDSDRRARFMLEARATSRISSPHIATLFDVGEHDGALFLVMEYVDGESLA